ESCPVERAEGVRATELEHCVPGAVVAEGRDGEARHVVERDPANRVVSAPPDRRAPVAEVELGERAKPDFHIERRPQNRPRQTALSYVALDRALRVPEGGVAIDLAREGHVDG